MLKRSVAIVLVMLYVGTVSGFALNLHYCFNRLSSVNIDVPAKACAKNLDVSQMKCCKNKHVEIKVKDAHQNGSFSFLAKTFCFDLPKHPYADLSIIIQIDAPEKLTDLGPPLSPPCVAIFIKNCTFRV